MGIYSETTPNTPYDDIPFEGPTAEEVTVDPLKAYCDKIYYMNTLFQNKGYGAINTDHVQIDGEWVTCLKMDYNYVNRFVKNMSQLGYSCTVLPGHRRRYRFIVIDGEEPLDLFHVFRHLEVLA